MKNLLIFLVLFAPRLILGDVESNVTFVANFPYHGTKLFEVLDKTLPKGTALAFLPEDVMRSDFKEDVSDADYDCYIYYDEGFQAFTSDGRGSFSTNDFIKRSKLHLQDVVRGYIVPIRSSKHLSSPIVLKDIIKSCMKTIQDRSSFEVIFVVEEDLLRRIVNSKTYKESPFDLAWISRLDRGQSIAIQNKDYKRDKDKLPFDTLVTIDLRFPKISKENELRNFVISISDRKQIVLFDQDEESINAFANFLDNFSVSSKGQKEIQPIAGGDLPR